MEKISKSNFNKAIIQMSVDYSRDHCQDALYLLEKIERAAYREGHAEQGSIFVSFTEYRIGIFDTIEKMENRLDDWDRINGKLVKITWIWFDYEDEPQLIYSIEDLPVVIMN